LQGDELGLPGTEKRNKVCVAEIYCELFGGVYAGMTKYNTKDLHDIMQHMPGWVGATPLRFGFYGLQKAYVRVNVPIELDTTKLIQHDN
jgi:putative DNA primase/helicase